MAENKSTCSNVRKDIRQFIDDLRDNGTPDLPSVTGRLEQWHDQLLEAEKDGLGAASGTGKSTGPVASTGPIQTSGPAKTPGPGQLVALQERVKELKCLYAVIDALQSTRPDLNMDSVLNDVAGIIPRGFRYPDKTAFSINIRESVYASPGFTHSEKNLVSRLRLPDEALLEIRAGLPPGTGEPLFLDEEQVLLDKIARLIRRFYNHLMSVAELSDREERFRTIIYSIGDGVITTDRNGQVRRMNRVAEQLTGWTEDEARGNPVNQIFPIISEETGKKVDSPVHKVLNRGIVVGLANHTLLISRDGSEIPIVNSGAPIKNTNGSITGMVLVFRDQLEERAIQNKLEESEKKFRSIVEYAPEPIFIQTEHRFAFLNPAAVNLYGANDAAELIGTPVMDRFHPDFHEEIRERFRHLTEMEVAVTQSSRQIHLKVDGTHVWVETTGSPIEYEGRKGGLVFVRDVSQQNRHESVIRKNLKEKEVLLAEIHHRVKNNLAVIAGLLELEAGTTDNPEIIEALRKSESRVRSMALIHEKLYQSDTLADIDFKTYITELAGHIQDHYNGRVHGVSFRFDLEQVHLDVTRAVPCGIILNELITNGLKYAFPGHASGEITLSLRMHGDDEILLQYQDNGAGLPEEIMEQFRSGKATTLGMELIAALTRQLNGKLDIARDDGTRIVLRFPK